MWFVIFILLLNPNATHILLLQASFPLNEAQNKVRSEKKLLLQKHTVQVQYRGCKAQCTSNIYGTIMRAAWNA
jgi:hypothetical protein